MSGDGAYVVLNGVTLLAMGPPSSESLVGFLAMGLLVVVLGGGRRGQARNSAEPHCRQPPSTELRMALYATLSPRAYAVERES